MLPSNYYYTETNNQPTYTTDKEQSNFTGDEFMSMFLEQLKHQDPTEPEDSDKILEQTSQLANLEAINKQTETLEKLGTNLDKVVTTGYVDYIGKEVELVGNEEIFTFDGTNQEYLFNLPENTDFLSVVVTNEEGEVVKTFDNENATVGLNRIVWNGTNDYNKVEDAGMYKWNVIALDSESVPVQYDTTNFRINSIINKNGTLSFSLDERGLIQIDQEKISVIKGSTMGQMSGLGGI